MHHVVCPAFTVTQFVCWWMARLSWPLVDGLLSILLAHYVHDSQYECPVSHSCLQYIVGLGQVGVCGYLPLFISVFIVPVC